MSNKHTFCLEIVSFVKWGSMSDLSMRQVPLRIRIQALTQLSSPAQFVTCASFMNNIHPITKKRSHNWMFSMQMILHMA